MMLIDKSTRRLLIGGALALTTLLIWWVYIYSPLQDRRDELTEEAAQLSQEHERLTQRLEKLSDTEQNKQEIQNTLSRLSDLTLQGKGLEEFSAHTQLWVQEFLENHDLSLNAYKSLSPSRWRDYPLGCVQFQLSTTTQGLSDLLENLEKVEKAFRIEELRTSYKRSKEHGLRVTLHLGALFVEGIDK